MPNIFFGEHSFSCIFMSSFVWYLSNNLRLSGALATAGRNISITFDLKGSLRGRFAKIKEKGDPKVTSESKAARRGFESPFSSGSESDDDNKSSTSGSSEENEAAPSELRQRGAQDATHKSSTATSTVFLDGDFLEYTNGRPLPINDRSKALFHNSILNDTLFLSMINVLDYSILVGIDEERMELVVGIIDFMVCILSPLFFFNGSLPKKNCILLIYLFVLRFFPTFSSKRQYDILKQMERVGKSIPMVVGSEAPTIIQPPLYKARFTNAMERYFFTVPSKWTSI